MKLSDLSVVLTSLLFINIIACIYVAWIVQREFQNTAINLNSIHEESKKGWQKHFWGNFICFFFKNLHFNGFLEAKGIGDFY